MSRAIRVASLNLQGAMRSELRDLPRLIANHRPDVLLLQECRGAWLDDIVRAVELDESAFSYAVAPGLDFPAQDGCAIAIRSPVRLDKTRVWRIPPGDFQPRIVGAKIVEEPVPDYETLPKNLACRYSGRALLAELSLDGRRFVAASFHATPGRGWIGQGRGRVHEFKPFFHGGVVVALSHLRLPYIFGIDANEPRRETMSAATFHWAEGRSGFKKIAALLSPDASQRIHPARDLLRESLERSGTPPADSNYLVMTHRLRGRGGGRRYDSIWATSDFELEELGTYYDEARQAGTDHALLVADLRLG